MEVAISNGFQFYLTTRFQEIVQLLLKNIAQYTYLKWLLDLLGTKNMEIKLCVSEMPNGNPSENSPKWSQRAEKNTIIYFTNIICIY